MSHLKFISGKLSFLPLVASLIVASTGCSESPERNYAIPTTLCGLKFDKETLEPLFKNGEELNREDFGPLGDADTPAQGCHYYIDGFPKVMVDGNWRNSDIESSPASPEAQIKSLSKEEPKKIAGKYAAATWSEGGVAEIPCKRPNRSEDRYLVTINAKDVPLNDQPGRSHEVFGKLVQAAMYQVKNKLPCEKD